jgi:RNA polymerase-binding transcription factor DksA
MTNSVVRYSDAELAEFKALIEKKLHRAQEQFEHLQEQIFEITENSSDEHGGDWVDDSSINNDVEMLNNMAIRQRMYIRELENALIRIRNRSYGICSVTGELIDKRRLLAVPTTTKSLAAKTVPPSHKAGKTADRPARPASKKGPSGPKVITKIIRKPAADKPKPIIRDDDDDDPYEDDLFFEDDDPLSRTVGKLDLEELPDDVDLSDEEE